VRNYQIESYRLSIHAQQRMSQRGVGATEVLAILNNPDEIAILDGCGNISLTSNIRGARTSVILNSIGDTVITIITPGTARTEPYGFFSVGAAVHRKF
jgi:hypothetical protein